jgi:hypothetical protein
VTLTLGNTPPVVSVTVPLTDPVKDWERTQGGNAANIAKKAKHAPWQDE